MRHRSLIFLSVLLAAGGWKGACAQPAPPPTQPTIPHSSMVYVKEVRGNFETIYKRVFEALENNGFYVLFETNVGRNLALYASRWGANYNRNHLDEIRSIVFCNGAYANKISNADPQMLALCPLHVTLVQKGAVTSILFVRPSRVAEGSVAEPVALNAEQDVIRAIESGVKDFTPASARPGAPSAVVSPTGSGQAPVSQDSGQ